MNGKDFTSAFTVNQTPEQAFDAIKNVRGWWSEELEGSTEKIGDEFVYRHGDVHYSKQKVTELIPGEKVSWLVLDSRLSFVEDKSEWNGTTITFSIAKNNNKTEVCFTQVGLVPDLECYSDCSMGWDYYFQGSLQSLISTGIGTPDTKRVGGEP